MMDGWHMTGWGWAAMSAMTLVVVALVVVLVLLLARGSSPGPRSQEPLDPEQIMAQRFARGEIDETEYQRRRQAINARDQRSSPS